MEKFSDYEKWFEIIKKKCNKENFIGNLKVKDRLEKAEIKNYDGYKMDNGYYVYITEDSIIIRDEPLSQDKFDDESRSFGDREMIIEYNSRTGDKVIDFSAGYVYEDSKWKSEAYIVYSCKDNKGNSTLLTDLDDEEFEEEKELTEEEISEKNIVKLLLDALEKCRNNPNADQYMIEQYSKAIEFYNQISSLVKQKDEQTVHLEGGVELEGLSEEELEKILQSASESNRAKEEQLKELRRRELIAQIKQEQQKGKELDAKIEEVKARTTENR